MICVPSLRIPFCNTYNVAIHPFKRCQRHVGGDSVARVTARCKGSIFNIGNTPENRAENVAEFSCSSLLKTIQKHKVIIGTTVPQLA